MERQKKAALKDEQIYLERKSKYLGTALIALQGLYFETANSRIDPRARQIEKEKAVKKLVRNFGLEGCSKLDEERHVSAIISSDELGEAIERSQISLESLRSNVTPPKLLILPSRPLRCLYGRHRLKAAHNYFQQGEDWWVVDLFADDLSTELETHLREGYSNSTGFCDGEILCHIFLYQECGDELNEMKWWARLSRDKKKDLKHILKIPGFFDAFNNLTVIPGLWGPFHIGTFRRYSILKCHEYLLNYLRRIYTILSFIAGNDKEIMALMDSTTIKAMELRAPQVSTDDEKFISDGMESLKLFRLVRDPSTREKIKQNIMALPYQYLILTLSSFCEDTKYLEPVAKSMRLLVNLEPDETIDQAFRRIYTRPNCDPGRLLRQDNEHSIIQVIGDEDIRFRYSLWQVVLKCMRSFPELVNIACRKDADEAKPPVTEPNAVIRHQLASLALDLGFDSDEIQALLSKGPEAWETYMFLTRLEPEQDVDEAQLKSDVQEHLQLWHMQKNRRSHDISANDTRPRHTVETMDQDLLHRCGRPFNGAHKSDKKFLFPRWTYDTKEGSGRGRFITSFFVKLSFFVAFFEEEDVPLGHASSTDLRLSKELHVDEAPTHRPVSGHPPQFDSEEASSTALVLSDYDFEMAGDASVRPDNLRVDTIMFNTEGSNVVHRAKAIFHLEGYESQICKVDFSKRDVQDAALHFAHNKFKLVFKAATAQQIVLPEKCYQVMHDWGARDMWCRLPGPFPSEEKGERGKRRKVDAAGEIKIAAFRKAILEIEEL